MRKSQGKGLLKRRKNAKADKEKSQGKGMQKCEADGTNVKERVYMRGPKNAKSIRQKSRKRSGGNG